MARVNSLNVTAGTDETVNPCGCKPEQGIQAIRCLPGYGAKLNAAMNRRGLTPPTLLKDFSKVNAF